MYLTLTYDGKIKKMSMTPPAKKLPPVTLKPKKDVDVLATVTYAHGSVYKLTYAFGGKTKTSQLATHAEVSFAQTHHLKVGSKVYLTLTYDGKIKKMSMTPTTPPAPAKKTPPAKDDGDDDDKHSKGHVTKVPGKHTFHVTYHHHGHKRTFEVTHKNHGRKPGDTVTVSKDPATGKMTSWTAGGGSSGSGACPFSFQTRNSAGQCVGCPSGTTWNNTTKKCETTRGEPSGWCGMGMTWNADKGVCGFPMIKPKCDKWSPVCGPYGDCSNAGKGKYTCQNGCCKCADSSMWNGRDCSGK